MPQDVVEAVNGVEVGVNLSVLTDEINKVETNGPIRFTLSRRAKDEDRRIKMLANKKLARKLDMKLIQIFNQIDTDGSKSLSLAEIDAAGKQIFVDALGIHFPDTVNKNGFGSLEQFAHVGDGKIDFEQFRGVIYSKELALSSRKTRHAKYAVLFKKLDKDDSGEIDKTEFLGADELLRKLFGENSAAICDEFASSDSNEDGKLCFEEFANGAEDFYERFLHPDAFEEEENAKFTHEQSKELMDEHHDDEHEEETPTVAISGVSSIVVSKVEVEGETEAVEEEEDEAAKAARELVEAQHQEMEDKKEAAAQQKHKEELAAQKKAKEEAKKQKAAAAEKKRQEAEEKQAAEEAIVPAKAGCCVIA